MDSPLHKLGDRVLLSPHSASYTEGGELRQGVAWATRSVVTALKGGIPDNVYNREVIPRWKGALWRRQRDLHLASIDNPFSARIGSGFCRSLARPNHEVLMKKQSLKPCVLRMAAARHGICCNAPWNLILQPTKDERDGPDWPGGKVTTMLVAILNFLRAWRRYNASLKELYQLGDRELADIGITRSDIPRIAWDSSQRANS